MAKQKFNFNASKRILGIDDSSAPNSLNETCPSTPGDLYNGTPKSPCEPQTESSGSLGDLQNETPRSSGDLQTESSGSPSDLEFPKSPQRMELRYIPRRKIRTNKKNNYPMSELESLENSILLYGLQQPLTVIYIMEEDKYVIEAGHRRCSVLDQLVDKYKNFENKEDLNYILYLQNVKPYEVGYPCIVADRLNEDMYYDVSDEELSEKAIDSEIRLIITNEEIRSTSAQVKAQNVQRLTELYNLKNKGKKRSEKININEQISSDLNIGVTQVKNYKAVNSLIPELKQLFDSSNISLKEGSNYSSLTEEEQMQIANLIQTGHKVREADVKAIKQEKKDMEAKFSATLQDLENNIHLKERELASLKATLEQSHSSVTESSEYKQLQEDKYEMEETILELRNELLSLQNKQKHEKTPIDEKAFMEKLKVKSAYEQAHKSVEEFTKICNTYLVTDNSFTKEYEALVDNLNKILKGE